MNSIIVLEQQSWEKKTGNFPFMKKECLFLERKSKDFLHTFIHTCCFNSGEMCISKELKLLKPGNRYTCRLA